MFVKPAQPELLVPVPGAAPHERWLPPEGREVPDDQYWRRRIADGEVIACDPPHQPKTEESGAARRRKE
jgi:hypothetical protein